MSDLPQIVTFWDGDPADIAGFAAEWRGAGLEPKIVGSSEGAECLREVAPGAEALFRRIRIPACRSDVARLALLLRDGGLYVDAHCGCPDRAALRDVQAALRTHEVVAFTKRPKRPGAELEMLINGVICARPRAPQLELVLRDVMANLCEQERIEAASDAHAPFNVAALTGAWVMKLRWVHIGLATVALREEIADRVALRRIADAPTPLELYAHYDYRRKGAHWSERQLHERLFEPRG